MANKYNYQQNAFNYLLEKFHTQEPFTKKEFQVATGWTDKSFGTYFSKQFKTLLLQINNDDRYRVSEAFRRFITWESFQAHVTQNRHIATDYTVLTYDNVIIFEFFMPLTNEGYLRTALDALFYKDSIISRLKTMDVKILDQFIPKIIGETDEEYLDRVCSWISSKFGGYSISHVNGRFRADELKTIKEAYSIMSNSGRYLVDETTAIVRFIFPCGKNNVVHKFSSESYFEDLALVKDDEKAEDEATLIRLFFFKLFVQSIVLIVNGEDEIWMLESGMRNRLHIWRIED
jgi:hypothetical protein